MLPFLALPVIFAFNWLFERAWGVLLAAALVGLSVFHVGALTIAGQGWPPVDEFPLTVAQMNASFPLADHALPLLAAGDVARNYGGVLLGLGGLAGLLPLLAAVALIALAAPRLFTRRSAPQPRPARLAQTPKSSP